MATMKEVISSVGEDVGQLELSYTTGGGVKWFWGNNLAVSTKAKYMPTYDPAIPLLGIYPKKYVHQNRAHYSKHGSGLAASASSGNL